ncbi:MAG: hypothetical protein HY666_00100 [Chloroflexi bacterium]|nr:hypothetical protein [Chloroflexota bacterium]
MVAKNLCTECSLNDLSDIILEVERSDKAADSLLAKPRVFFEERGYFVPPSAKFYITSTTELHARLQMERGVEDFLFSGRPSVAAFEVHIEEGKGKCTKLEVQ